MITYSTSPKFIQIYGLPEQDLRYTVSARLNEKVTVGNTLSSPSVVITPDLFGYSVDSFPDDVYSVNVYDAKEAIFKHDFVLRYNAGCRLDPHSIEGIYLDIALRYAEHCGQTDYGRLSIMLKRFIEIAGTADPRMKDTYTVIPIDLYTIQGYTSQTGEDDLSIKASIQDNPCF